MNDHALVLAGLIAPEDRGAQSVLLDEPDVEKIAALSATPTFKLNTAIAFAQDA